MQARFTLAVLLGVVLIAAGACSSGGDDERIAELETNLEASEEAVERETEARETAEQEAAEAKQRADAAEDETADAEQRADAAEEETADAEERADDAEDETADAEEARRTAEAARQAAARARQAAEERRQAAEERLNQSAEERQSAGFGTSAGTLVVTPRNAEPAVITTPDIGEGVTGTTQGNWAVTNGSTSDGTYRDEVTVYSDVGPDVPVPFQDSQYNAGRRVFDAEGEFVAGYPISGARTDVSDTGGLTQFPSTSAPPKTFNLEDRGYYETAAQQTAARTACSEVVACLEIVNGREVRNTETYPLRYSVDVMGETLGDAAGIFRCESSSRSTACTVQNRGGDQLFFTGPWRFTPGTIAMPNEDQIVMVPDGHYMWFGWWARQQIATKEWSYAVGHGPAGSRVSSVSAVSGTATYAGSAIGRFAIDDPLDDTDQVGRFKAEATLNADFDENTLSGTVSTFVLTEDDPADQNDLPDQGATSAERWTVHLRKSSISGGSASGTSAWSIGNPVTTDNVDEGGEWSGNFYSDLPANQRAGVVPYGFAGTFTAEHTGAANMIGAFGAHK